MGEVIKIVILAAVSWPSAVISKVVLLISAKRPPSCAYPSLLHVGVVEGVEEGARNT